MHPTYSVPRIAILALLTALWLALGAGAAWAQAPTIDKSKSYVGTEGTVIVLTFDRELDTSIDGIPPASAFSISTTLGAEVQIGTFAISDFDNKQLVIRGLTPTIYLGHHAEITYTDPSTGDDTDVLQDAITGEDVPTFSILGLRNLSEIIPSGPPIIIEAEVDTAGTSIGLAFNKALDETITGPSFKSSFSVNVGSRALEFTGISFSGHTLNLDGLSPRIHEGDTVRVTYRDPSPADDAVALQDEAGVDANSFTTGTGGVIAIRNGSTYVASTVIKPEFYGSARVGSTLRSPGRYLLENRNIDPVPVFTYTWHHYENNRYGTAIAGADTHTYSPTNSDVGKQIGIRISFTEAGVTKAGFSDPVTIHRASLPSTCPAFSAPSGRAEIWNARIHIGSHPRAGDRGAHGYVAGTNNSRLTTQGGPTPITGFTYNGTTYRVQEILAVATTSPSLDITIQPPLPPRLRETLRFHACGETYPFRNAYLQNPPLGAHYGWYNAGVNWGPRSGSTLDIHLTIAGSPASGSITLSGTPEVGQTLTGEVTGLSDPDGPPGTKEGNPTDYVLNYQWYRYDSDGRSNPRPIAGATGTSYVVTQDDVGKRLRVRATFLDDTGNLETLVSPLNQAASAAVPQPQAIIVSTNELTVDRGGYAEFTVRLAHNPGKGVTISFTRSLTNFAIHGRNIGIWRRIEGITFDETNWNTPRPLRVQGSIAALPSAQGTVRLSGDADDVGPAQTITVHYRDTTGADTDWDLRLEGSATPGEGRLEVAYNGKWGTVCDDRIHIPQNRAPTFACRLMGFAYGDPIANRNTADFNASDVPIHLDDLVCLNSDNPPSYLAGCESAPTIPHTNCRHSEDLWLRCDGELASGEPVFPTAPALAIQDSAAIEGQHDTIQFRVTLSPALTGTDTVTVDYRTVDGTALAPVDYIESSGTITFSVANTPPHANNRGHGTATDQIMSAYVNVPIINDGVEDSGEKLHVQLSNIGGTQGADSAHFISARGTGVIYNEDHLAGSFENLPTHHGGEAFTVELAFNDATAAQADKITAAITATGGTVTGVTPTEEGGTRSWQVTVQPSDARTPVTLSIPKYESCASSEAICRQDGTPLSSPITATVQATVLLPVIAGIPQAGETLQGSYTRSGVAWQWLRGEEAIAGAQGATYAPVAADVGSQLAVRVSFGDETATSEPTAPVWPAPANPPLATGEEELLSATLTLGASDEFPLQMGGYNRFVGTAFGEMDETSFDEGTRSHVVEMVMINELGRLSLATQGPPPPAGGLAVYWNAHRIAGLKRNWAVPGRAMLVAPSGIPRETYLKFARGEADGLKVAVSVRRTHAVVSVTGASVTSGPGDNGIWDEDETVAAALTFSAPVAVSGGPPTLGVLLDGNRREAAYRGGSGTDTLTFTWTVGQADAGAKRARLAPNGLALNGATLTAGANTAVDTAFAVPPWVTAVAIAPDASGDREWTPGETIEAELAFSEAVTVNDGSPWIEIRIGGFAHHGTLGYASGSGSATLVFSTEVPAGASGFTGLALVADSLEANGASIVSAASGLAAELGHDGTEPTAASGESGATEPLTAAFHDVPASHDGTAFTLELRFGEPVPASAAAPGAFIATGATVGEVSAQDERTWSLTVTPDGAASAVTVTLPARDCTETGAVCAAAGRGLESDVSASVAALPGETPFRVSLEGLPEEHDGTGDIVFRVVFNKRPAGFSYTVLRDATLRIHQGGNRLTPAVKRVLSGDDRNTQWRVTVAPGGHEDVTVAIGPFSECSDAGAICTEDEEVVSNHIDETVLGPPGLSVADARVYEAPGAMVDFKVTLGRASRATVHVDYATSDGAGSNAAVAGDDYAETSGTLAFAPGETEHTVSVLVYQDGHDEGEETFTLTLSNPQGGNAWLKDATATGTIENADAMPRAWLARFGRTVAEQVIEAVEGRLSAGRTAGVEMTLAGERIGLSGPGSESGAGAAGEDGARAGFRSRVVTGRDVFTGSSFALTAEAKAGGLVSLWGRGAVSRFDGRDGDLSLDGEVTSVMLGTDWVRERWTSGLLVSRAAGEGGYRGPDAAGAVESTLTGLFPYGRYAASERVTVWGVTGYGAGELKLTPEGPDGESRAAMRTDMDLAMAAVGLRGVAVEAPAEGGVELAVKTDALAVRTTSEKAKGLAAAEAGVTRLRLGLEGTWRGLEASGGTLSPRLEVGVRHDGGDAETGFGLDLGGGLSWSHPASGLSAELSGRGLLTHEAPGFRDRGLSGSFAWDPGQGSGHGPRLTLTRSIGSSAAGGVDALLRRETLAGLAPGDPGASDDDLANRRLELRFGYGLPAFGRRFTATPEAGVGLSNGRRDYRLVWRLDLARGGAGALGLQLEATRSAATGANDNVEPEDSVGLRATARW